MTIPSLYESVQDAADSLLPLVHVTAGERAPRTGDVPLGWCITGHHTTCPRETRLSQTGITVPCGCHCHIEPTP